jgi:hypothetical protein
VSLPPISWRRGGLAALLLLLTSCERGALMNWLLSLGVGGDHGSPTERGSFKLHEVDCPAGLARCVDGVIELSQAGRHPEPCSGSPESCLCPWSVVGRCDGACVAGDVAVPFTVSQAKAQLCAQGPMDAPVAAPPPLGAVAPVQVARGPSATPTPSPCEDERYRCSDGRVIDCGGGRIVASCLRGCAVDGATLDDESVGEAAAVLLLCSR